MNVTTTDKSAVKKEQERADKISLSIVIPVPLFEKIKSESVLNKIPVGTMLEKWAEELVSPEDVTISLATLMKHPLVREKPEKGVKTKTLTVPVTWRHYSLIRLETLRRNTTLRALLKGWIQENVKGLEAKTPDQEKRPENSESPSCRGKEGLKRGHDQKLEGTQ